MTDNAHRAGRPRLTLRTILGVAAWGAITAGGSYAISRGSIPIFVAVMLAIGVLQRVVAVRIARRRGDNPPAWWKI